MKTHDLSSILLAGLLSFMMIQPTDLSGANEETKYIAELKTKAAAGAPDALHEYGVLLIHGRNELVPANRPEGYRLLDKATAKGHIKACQSLYSYLRSEAEGRATTGSNSGKNRPQGTNTEILTEAIKYFILYGGQRHSAPKSSDSTWEEGERRAREWAEKNGQTIPIKETK